MSTAVDTTTDIRTFRIDIADEQIDDLRRRIAATRWPSKELVDGSLAGRAARDDPGARPLLDGATTTSARVEARLNALPQFTTEIDGVDIHFIHVRSPHEDAMPLIMTHGWPGSVIELLETVGPLTDPTAHGGDAEDAFHLVLPSMPGYGFSGEPTEVGWDAGRIAQAWAELMRRLGYTRYVAQGGDVGAVGHRRDGPPGARGAARHPPQRAHGGGRARRARCRRSPSRNARRTARSTRSRRTAPATSWRWPPGRRRSGTPCWIHPSALAAWMLDHDTDGYYKIAGAFVDGQARGQSHSGQHPRQRHAVLVDRHRRLGGAPTGTTGRLRTERTGPQLLPLRLARLFRRSRFRSASRRSPARSGLPRAAGSRQSYPTLTYFNKVDRGGHFAAWEEPELFSDRGAGRIQVTEDERRLLMSCMSDAAGVR